MYSNIGVSFRETVPLKALKHDFVDFYTRIHSDTTSYARINLRTVHMKTCNFQSALHDNSKTWADAGPLKVKYLENVVNFKGILQSNPLIF